MKISRAGLEGRSPQILPFLQGEGCHCPDVPFPSLTRSTFVLDPRLKHQEGLKYVNPSGNHTGCQNSVRTAASSSPDWSRWFHGQRLYIPTRRVPLAPAAAAAGTVLRIPTEWRLL